MRHQPCDAAIAIEEWMYPQKPMMGSGNREDRICLSEIAVDLCKAAQEAGHGARTDGHVMANANISFAQLAGYDSLTFLRRRIFYPKKIVRKQFAESPVRFTDSLGAERADSFEAAFIDPSLDRNMGRRFELEIPFLSVLAVVVSECSLDVHRVRIMTLDEIRVVTVHGTNKGGGRGQ
jgi:hypothetical protein